MLGEPACELLLSGRRWSGAGFTIVELVMVVLLSSIVFVGLAAMFAQAFRSEAQALRQTQLQGAATLLLSKLQHDIVDATYIIDPASGASGTLLRGFKQRVFLGNSSGNWTNVGPSPVQFLYWVCTGTAGVSDGVYYYETANTATTNTVPASCAAPPPAWLGASPVQLVGPPVTINAGEGTFDAQAANIGNGMAGVHVFVVLRYKVMQGSPAVPPFTIDTVVQQDRAFKQP